MTFNNQTSSALDTKSKLERSVRRIKNSKRLLDKLRIQ